MMGVRKKAALIAAVTGVSIVVAFLAIARLAGEDTRIALIAALSSLSGTAIGLFGGYFIEVDREKKKEAQRRQVSHRISQLELLGQLQGIVAELMTVTHFLRRDRNSGKERDPKLFERFVSANNGLVTLQFSIDDRPTQEAMNAMALYLPGYIARGTPDSDEEQFRSGQMDRAVLEAAQFYRYRLADRSIPAGMTPKPPPLSRNDFCPY